MGLDTVELVLRTEEAFGINLPDEEYEQIVTVGDLYRAVLKKLELPYRTANEIETSNTGISRLRLGGGRIFRKDADSIEPDPGSIPWTTPDVWLTLHAIIADQLALESTEIREEVTFLQDLGCD